MDGYFLELDAESIEGEVDDYMRDLFRVQKVFNNKFKKILAEWDERQRIKKRERQKMLLSVSIHLLSLTIFCERSPFVQGTKKHRCC